MKNTRIQSAAKKAAIAILSLLAFGVISFWAFDRYERIPLVRYTCRVYHIYGESDTLIYTSRFAPSQPRWRTNGHTYRYTTSNGGWSNDFDDPTICRFVVLKADTIKQNKQ